LQEQYNNFIEILSKVLETKQCTLTDANSALHYQTNEQHNKHGSI